MSAAKLTLALIGLIVLVSPRLVLRGPRELALRQHAGYGAGSRLGHQSGGEWWDYNPDADCPTCRAITARLKTT
jgi:hypothetical protein